MAFDPVTGRQWIKNVSDEVAAVSASGYQPVILCSSVIRLQVKTAVERELPGIVVISDKEIVSAGSSISITVLGTVNYREGAY